MGDVNVITEEKTMATNTVETGKSAASFAESNTISVKKKTIRGKIRVSLTTAFWSVWCGACLLRSPGWETLQPE